MNTVVSNDRMNNVISISIRVKPDSFDLGIVIVGPPPHS